MTPTTIEGLPDGRPALAAGRGTAALMVAVAGLGLGGREMLVPANLCPIAVAGLIWAGVRPVLHDVDPETGNARPDDIARAWRPGCAAVLVVHNFGMPVAVDAVATWAAKTGVTVLEDCCNAPGATVAGRPVGTFSAAAVYAFGGSKIIDAGGGGAVSAGDPAVLEAIAAWLADQPEQDDADRAADAAMEAALRRLRVDPDATPAAIRRVYEDYRPHAARRLDAAGAARIAAALAALPQAAATRREQAARWQALLEGGPARPVAVPAGAVPWRFNILVDPERRDALVAALRRAGHPCSTWYPPVAALFSGETGGPGTYPGARRFAAGVVNLWVDGSQSAAAMEATAREILTVLEAPRP
ncbi:DegT/DnrJ/EryC1/StrS aminotransferase [Caenispirillum salinarum AK4]|uniref:DegT/DnrJ/EryC1/StrS aminotransferase n=1 Tax=Caenispirillum salinarum AK4 TaxID=1238182 RepID=K9HB96_9PROT|nr:DegT/DnrJ/EryC1/StrS family aminotransferase [Caenispirillum salinarum]EKV26041.1 DegT/DnrJ/EryC1/StrS aminotransferase [Caenispirillum salinarum AK4]